MAVDPDDGQGGVDLALQMSVARSIQEGTFMPFLGAGASTLEPFDSPEPPWQRVIDRLKLLHVHTKEPEDRRYLESQARLRLGISLSAGDDDAPERGPWRTPSQDPLLILQLELVRLGSHLVELFGRSMVETRVSVVDAGDYQVEISEAEQLDLAYLLLDTMDAAHSLMTEQAAKAGNAGQNRFRLPATDIYNKLCAFACQHAGRIIQTRDEFEHRRSDHTDNMCAIQDLIGRPSRAELKLDELGWLEDLLWYTLRYPVPVYPTTAELAFHLSLGIPSLPPTGRGELAEMAELHLQTNARVPLGTIISWLRYCEEFAKPSRFHISMASALWWCYQRFKEQLAAHEDAYLPLAFTTNYDRTLERALEMLNVGTHTYHILLPVVQRPARGVESRVLWLLQTVRVEDCRPKPGTLYECFDLEYDAVRQYIEGPVIVKLHGSPLVDLPPGDAMIQEWKSEKTVKYRNLDHAIVLSESSYLQSVLEENHYPVWVRQALETPDRVLWFLGYSLADWNVRVRLFEQVRASQSGNRQSSNRRESINKYYDPLRSAILRTLDVSTHRHDLRVFDVIIRNVREVAAIIDKTEQGGF